MKFDKTLFLGINEYMLSSQFKKRIKASTKEIIYLQKGSNDLKNHLVDTDCLLTNFGINIDKEIISNAPKLKYIGILATAYGRIDVDIAKKKRIVVCNIPGYSTESVAEFVFAVILEQLRKLELGKKRCREENYSESGFVAEEIKGKRFGIIGLGKIGLRVAEIALGFGADVKYWSRNRKKEAENKGIRYESLDKLIANTDFISINLAQTKETEGIFNKKRFKIVKKGTVIVNTAPMELVNIEGLGGRLKKGDIIFILDHSDEMSKKDLAKISKFDNCIIYPPIAYVSKEAFIAKQEIFTSNIEDFLSGTPKNKVN